VALDGIGLVRAGGKEENKRIREERRWRKGMFASY
jgi:hypothetical protein